MARGTCLMDLDILLGAQVPPLRDGEPLCLSPTLLRAWSTRTQQVDTGEAAALAVLHRTDPAHSPATFSHALGELFLPAGGRRRRSRGRGRARPGTAALAPDPAPRKRPADAELGLSKRTRRSGTRAELEPEPEPEPVPTAAPAAPRTTAHQRVSAHVVSRACERCVRDGRPEWLLPLRTLLESGAVSATLCPPLLPALCLAAPRERRVLPLLCAFVRHAAEIAEAQLLGILALALRHRRALLDTAAAADADADAVAAGGGGAGTAASEEVAGWEELIDVIIRVPRNDVFLLQVLRPLALPDCVQLLQRLLQLLATHAQSWRADGIPSVAQVVAWLNVLIDAHFSQLLVHAPAHALLSRLGKLARRHVQLCSATKILKGHVDQASSRSGLPARPPADYSVELLTL